MPDYAVAPGKLLKNGKCPPGFEKIEGEGFATCMAKSACQHPDSSGQCWDVPGYGPSDPQYGCFNCGRLTYYNLSSGYRALDADGWLVAGPRAPGAPRQDAFCRLEKGDGWQVKGNVCPPCQTPKPTPVPSPTPTTPPVTGPSDVASLLLLNYGKCKVGQPFVFYLNDPTCRELLVTATPKSAEVCDGKACDAVNHGRDLTWVANGRVSKDDEILDLGCATIEPGPVELTFNRKIIGVSECTFPLMITLVDPAGKTFTKTVTVEVRN